ncbi:MAG: hypothetical protein QG671_1360 [Actinomycetota bacterium]|nr:hypothetical protein [Actinomycetota bacterium]
MTGSRWRRWPAQAEHGRLVGRVSGSDSLGLCTQGGHFALNAQWNALGLRGAGKPCGGRVVGGRGYQCAGGRGPATDSGTHNRSGAASVIRVGGDR